ncbi:MAG: ABC transporter permease [Elusimicrobia bacterium RIFOXYA2_FULL_39_19]|nr:MAG: ABC transporter permease [Elusimicrobia bacterium RIFOXYA2_FULL_39_19]
MNKELRSPLLFIAPVLTFILIFILLPVIGTVVTSLYKDITYLDNKFIFFENYRQIFQDPGFWQSLRFTMFFILVSIPLEMLLGLIFAILIDQEVPYKGFLRVCILIPWAIPAAISSRTWELIYNYNYGLANFICSFTGISVQPVNWLGTSLGAFFSLVLADVWKTTPFIAIILLTGLQIIPGEIYLQAQVDRANFLQRFFKITLPLLKPVFIVALLFRTIDGLRIFDIIYILTHGGPGGATASLSHYSYKYFLAGDFGYGSAVSTTLFIISFLLSLVYLKFGKFQNTLS